MVCPIECDVNKNKIIRSLNLYLTECQSQYSDCFGEASEQAALLELQRDAIGTLQKRIKFLECDELLNAFMLHFIYYVILSKYQRELATRTKATKDMQTQIENLMVSSSFFEQRCDDLQFQCDKANKDMECERNEFESTREKILKEKQTEIEALLRENNDLKKQLQAFKVDFKLIEEEMQKMGLPDQSLQHFKEELEGIRLQNMHFECQLNKQDKLISTLEHGISCRDNDIKILKSKLSTTEAELDDLRNNLMIAEKRASSFATTVDQMARLTDGQKKKIVQLKQNLAVIKTHYDRLRMDYEILKSEKDLCEDKLKNENIELLGELNEAHRKINDEKELSTNLQKRIKSLSGCQAAHADRPQSVNYSENILSNQLALSTQKNDELEEVVANLKSTIEKNKEELGLKNNALSEIQAKLNQLSAKLESSERNCQHYKKEVEVIEKSLTIQRLKTQNCTEKNEELIRQNKSLEESNNKCMEELQDIVLQLEDMQSSLVELRNECDSKTKSLECVSVELEKMKVSRSEVCEESKYVLQWVRYWMREQKMIVKVLQDKLYEKQHRLLAISSEKKKFMVIMKRLRRKHRMLEKRLRLIRKPATKQVNPYANGYSLPPRQCQRCSTKQKNGLNGYYSRSACEKESKAVLSVLKLESRKGTNHSKYIVKMQGDSKLIPDLQYISKELPRTSQIKDIIQSEGKAHEEVDNGYHTSGSKSSFS